MPASWIHDVRYALRMLRRSPVFTLTAILSLAIGIGATTTIFSIGSSLLLRPLPGLAEPERLIDVGRTQGGAGFNNSSYPNYRDLRERTTLLDGLYAYQIEPQPMSLGGALDAERIYGTIVTGNYFEVLGTRPQLGRLLRAEDDEVAGGSPVVVISHDLWQRRFSGDSEVAGRSITLNGRPFSIVGVAPPGFRGTTLLKPDAWVPISMTTQAAPRMSSAMLTERRIVWLAMGGRLKKGVTLDQARAELHAIGATLEREHPDDNRNVSFTAAASAQVPGRIGIVAGFVALLMAIVSLVLLIACVNLAGMLLARANARRREIAVRLAIGAGRRRLVRQLLTETAVLFVAGGLVGILLAQWLTALLLSLVPQLPMPVALEPSIDWRVVTFALLASTVAALLSGLTPALQGARADLAGVLKAEGEQGGTGGRLRHAFLAGQIALSLVLVIVGGLFLRAVAHAADIPTGFDGDNVEVVSLDLSLAGYTDEPAVLFARDLVSRASALPGVQAATLAVDLPLDGGRYTLGMLSLPGEPAPDLRGRGNAAPPADWNVIEPGFFRTMRVPLLRGRDFTDADGPGAPQVAIVSEALARRYWPDRDPLGEVLNVTRPDGSSQVTVVGIAGDARWVSLAGEPEPYIYVPFAQQYMSRVHVLVRTTGVSAIPAMRTLVREMNPALPLTETIPMSAVTAVGLVPQRIAAALAGSLGIVGLALAGIGIYGVTSYAVGRRKREIGVRMALGADRGTVVRLILRQSLTTVLTGVGLGVVLAALASQLLRSLLLGVGTLDLVTFAGACLLFTGVAAVATLIPALAASRVNPLVALKNH